MWSYLWRLFLYDEALEHKGSDKVEYHSMELQY